MIAARSRRARSNSRGEASREHILDAALELLQDRGYSGLSISAVCERADIAVTSVYWHFGNKAGLMEAVLRRVSGGYAEKIRAATAEIEDPEARLDALLSGIRELVTTQPLGSLTGVAIVGEGRHVTPELVDALHDAREQEFAQIAEAIEAELPGRGESLAVVTTACANYAALIWRMGQREDEVDRILDGLRQTFLQVSPERFPSSGSKP